MPKRLCGSFDEAMKRWSSAQLLRATEFTYAVLALFALTQGPVYQIWKLSGEQLADLPSPSLPFVYFASFIGIQLPGVFLLVRRARSEWFTYFRVRAFILFLGWMSLTVVWSTFARQSLPEIVALTLSSLFGMYLATSFAPRRIWWVIALAMALGVGLSWFAVMRLWDGAFNFIDGYWVGIYFNRNSLAPVAAVAIIAACGVLAIEFRRIRESLLRGTTLVVAPLVTLAVFASIEIWKSESQTSPFALVAAVLTLAVWLVLRQLSSRFSLFRWLKSWVLLATFVILGVALFVALREIGGFGGVSNEVATLNSRRAFWSLSWSGILDRPWLGWGWMAAWRSPEFFNLGLVVPDWDIVWSHNGYHDVLLGGGVVGGVLFLLYVFASLREMQGGATVDITFRVLMAAFVLTAATQESFFVGSHFMWVLLVAALTNSAESKNLVNKEHTS